MRNVMHTATAYVVVAAIVLALVALVSRRHWGANRVPLIVYPIGVAVVWAVVLGLARFIGGPARFNTFALVCAGFALGTLAMYIAVHVYKS